MSRVVPDELWLILLGELRRRCGLVEHDHPEDVLRPLLGEVRDDHATERAANQHVRSVDRPGLEQGAQIGDHVIGISRFSSGAGSLSPVPARS